MGFSIYLPTGKFNCRVGRWNSTDGNEFSWQNSMGGLQQADFSGWTPTVGGIQIDFSEVYTHNTYSSKCIIIIIIICF